MVGKSNQTGKDHVQWQTDERLLFPLCSHLKVRDCRTSQSVQVWPPSRGGQSVLLWTLLPRNCAIYKQTVSPSVLGGSIWVIRV